MANAFRITNAVAKAMANTFDDQANGGTAAVLNGRSGAQPACADAAETGTLLFQITMAAVAFGCATDGTPGGVLTAACTPLTDCCANASGCVGYVRMLTQACGTAVADGSAGTACADYVFNTVAITACSAVSVTSMTVTMPES